MAVFVLAEDSPSDRYIIESILKEIGFKVLSFDNGKDAFHAVHNSDEPVITILDWNMPEMNGVTVCQNLYNDPPKQPYYNIIVTAKTLETHIDEALDMGANDFIEKPIKAFELKARIKAGLRILSITELQIKSNSRLLDYTTRVEQIAQERAQQLIHAERLSSLGILSAGLAHEINNPVSFISVNIETLEENTGVLKSIIDREKSSLTDIERAKLFLDAIPEILKEMKSGISRIREIINGLKIYARSDSSNKTIFNINDCIYSAIKLCKNKLKYNIALDLNLNENPAVFASFTEIEQIIINLLINASDAIESHKEKGTISIATSIKQNNIIIEVKDDGPGIPEDKLNKIFTPFFTTKEVGKGTGLGLSISQNIIKSNNGDILAENNYSGGANFKIILPIKNRRQ